MKKTTLYAIGAGAILLAAVGYYVISKPDAVSGATAWAAPPAAETVSVEALTATEDVLVDSVSASGVVSGINEAVVVSETQGIIRSLDFTLGDSVQKGQALLKVDDSIASLNLQRAKDQLETAEIELRGTERLAESGGASTAQLTRARSSMSAARAQYETALKAWNDTTLRAPISGVVSSREDAATVGNIISAFARVARIVDNSAFRVQVSLGEREIGLVQVGAEAAVYVPSALGEEEISARVTAVGEGADPSTGSFPVVVSFDNKWGSRVKSGMSAAVEIAIAEGKQTVVVPLSSVLRRNDRHAVFVDEGGKARVREVVLGRTSGVRAEVLSGLEPGETLIISALTRLRDGVSVSSTNRGDSGTRE